MTIVVRTASLRYQGPDRLDITRSSGGAAGRPFAPSDGLLWPTKRELQRAGDLRNAASSLIYPLTPEERASLRADAEQIEAETWKEHEAAYRTEMRISYGRDRGANGWNQHDEAAWKRGVRPAPWAWQNLLQRDSVVLCCFCPMDAALEGRCHRRLLAGFLVKLGAFDFGELSIEEVNKCAT